jgi:hypothetical protein
LDLPRVPLREFAARRAGAGSPTGKGTPHMNLKASALAGGILWGFLVFAFTLLEAARGQGHALVKLSALYYGYTVTYPGSFLGLVYGFVSGALVAAAFCWLYNKFGAAAGAAAK